MTARRLSLFTFLLGTLAMPAFAGTLEKEDDPNLGTIYVATQGQTQVRLAPAAGANVYSIRYDGTELLKQPESWPTCPASCTARRSCIPRRIGFAMAR